jgi:hypothetical protein
VAAISTVASGPANASDDYRQYGDEQHECADRQPDQAERLLGEA